MLIAIPLFTFAGYVLGESGAPGAPGGVVERVAGLDARWAGNRGGGHLRAVYSFHRCFGRHDRGLGRFTVPGT